MTRETKIGLFVGMGVIILIGILISDHLSVAQRQEQPQFSRAFPDGSAESPDGLPGESVIDDARPLTPPGQLVSNLRAQRNPEPAPSAGGLSDPVRLVQDLDNLRPAAAVRNETADRSSERAEAAPESVFVEVDEPGLTAREVEGLKTLPLHTTKSAQPAANGRVIHFVKEGQTLSQIARQYYGPTGKWQTIFAANRSVIPNADEVEPGTRLVIPSLKPAAATTGAATPAPNPATATPAYIEYTLKRGETLSQVAARFLGSPGKWRQLHELNKGRIKDPNRVAPGTVLRIPKK